MKPIFFNTEMVQAILDGRKTTTRRIVKAEINDEPADISKAVRTEYGNTKSGLTAMFYNSNNILPVGYAPFRIKTGDILYVRETWKIDSLKHENPNYQMAIDFKALQTGYSQAEILCKFAPDRFKKFSKFYQKPGWQSPYFMPNEAARIFLKVTDVRAVRLKDIAPADAISEGIEYTANGPLHWHFNDCISKTPISRNFETYAKAFSALWNSTIKKSDLDQYAWDANPWVWILSFERCEKPEEKAGK